MEFSRIPVPNVLRTNRTVETEAGWLEANIAGTAWLLVTSWAGSFL